MGGIAQTLAHIGTRMREDHLLDLQDRKSQQDRSLKFLEAAMQNPGVDPESQQGLFNLYMQANTTPLDKWDAKKVSKGMADIMSQYHDRAVGLAQQNAEKQPANTTFQIPGGNYDAGGFEAHPPMAPPAPPGQQQLPTAALPEPPQYRATGPAQVPGMPTAMEMPGIAAPGPDVPGAVRPFIDPRRAMEQAVSQLQAIGISDPRDIVNALNKHALTTPPSREAQINEIAFMGYLQKAGGDPTKAFEMFQGALHPEASAKELTPEMQAFNQALKNTGDPLEAFRQVKTIGGATSDLTKEQQTANAAYEAQRRSIDPNYKLTAADYGKAKSWFDEQSMTPTQIQTKLLQAENLQELRASRRLNEANLSMHMQEFNATHSPAAISAIVKQMQADPDIFFSKEMTPDVRNLVGQAWMQQTGMPPPREVPAQVKTKEANSIIAANAVARLKKMLAENPVIQQRMGKWDGRLGNLEQSIGDTRGLSPQDSQIIQNFRSSVNYLFFQEGQALLQRSPQALMEELKVTSPSMKQGLPLFLGALDAVNGTASNNIQSANDYRFNRAPGSGSSSIPPNPPNGVNPFRVTPKK